MSLYGDRILRAAREELPDGGGVVEVDAPLLGPCDGVVLLPGRTVVAADVGEAWVTELVRSSDDVAPERRSEGLGRIVAGLVERLGGPAATVGVLTAATPRAAMLRGEFTRAGEPDPVWSAYRSAVRTRRFTDHGLTGAIDIGRGPAGRWESTVRAHRGEAGDARQLLAASLTLIPRDAVLFGSAPVHDVGALRTMLGGGFRPVGLEILLLTRPGEDGGPAPGAAAASVSSKSSRSSATSGRSGSRGPGRLARLFGAKGSSR